MARNLLKTSPKRTDSSNLRESITRDRNHRKIAIMVPSLRKMGALGRGREGKRTRRRREDEELEGRGMALGRATGICTRKGDPEHYLYERGDGRKDDKNEEEEGRKDMDEEEHL